MPDNTEALEDLLHIAKMRLAGYHEFLDPKTGEVTAVFPHIAHMDLSSSQAQEIEQAWEERTSAMMAAQPHLDPNIHEKTGDGGRPEGWRGPDFNGLTRGD